MLELFFLASAFIIVLGIFSVGYASAQEAAKPTPEQLAECEQLGIKPEKCSEQAILSKHCIGPTDACKDAHVPIDVNLNLIPVYVGLAGAFIAGIIYVKKTGRWKAKTP